MVGMKKPYVQPSTFFKEAVKNVHAAQARINLAFAAASQGEGTEMSDAMSLLDAAQEVLAIASKALARSRDHHLAQERPEIPRTLSGNSGHEQMATGTRNDPRG